MSIIRSARKTQFYVLPTATIEDDRLSWEARGMLVYLLQKPDNWNANVSHLIDRTKGCLGKHAGRDKVYSILKELRMAGYLVSSFKRVGGEFKGVNYEVSETPDLEAGAAFMASLVGRPNAPFTDLPETVENGPPLTDLPCTVPPLTAKPGAITSTERATSIEKATKNLTADPDEAGESTEEFSLSAEESKALEGCPDNYPSSPKSKTFATWAAYAIAFKAAYKQWPIYNAVMGSQLSKMIDRIGAEDSPVTARYYVESVTTPSIVNNCHPVSSMLSMCEAYLVKARAEQKKRLRREANEKAVEASLQPAPVAQPVPTASTKPQLNEAAKEARARLGLGRSVKP